MSVTPIFLSLSIYPNLSLSLYLSIYLHGFASVAQNPSHPTPIITLQKSEHLFAALETFLACRVGDSLALTTETIVQFGWCLWNDSVSLHPSNVVFERIRMRTNKTRVCTHTHTHSHSYFHTQALKLSHKTTYHNQGVEIVAHTRVVAERGLGMASIDLADKVRRCMCGCAYSMSWSAWHQFGERIVMNVTTVEAPTTPPRTLHQRGSFLQRRLVVWRISSKAKRSLSTMTCSS